MKQRAITALIFVTVMLLGLYSGKQSFAALFGVITALCLWEFFDMVFEEADVEILSEKAWLYFLECCLTLRFLCCT
jgi:CDP-diglyceride synthetase